MCDAGSGQNEARCYSETLAGGISKKLRSPSHIPSSQQDNIWCIFKIQRAVFKCVWSLEKVLGLLSFSLFDPLLEKHLKK